jgi:Flp pilus assembly CpaE family ATPase
MTRALLKKLLGDVPADKIHLLANRTGWRQQLDVREIEKVVGQSIEESIPDDPATVITAHNEGQPTLAASRRARMNRCFDRLAGKLVPAAR